MRIKIAVNTNETLINCGKYEPAKVEEKLLIGDCFDIYALKIGPDPNQITIFNALEKLSNAVIGQIHSRE
jgi:hypothetical protein